MPLLESDEREVKNRLLRMFMDTIETFELLSENSRNYFGENANQIRDAINEYLHDFVKEPDEKERIRPKDLIEQSSRVDLQRVGFYGSQLNLKERQVTEANSRLRAPLKIRSNKIRQVGKECCFS